MASQDAVNKMIQLGFGPMFSKLSWFERIYTLDLAQKLKYEKYDEVLSLVIFSFKVSTMGDLLSTSKLDINGMAHNVTASSISKLMQALHLAEVEDADVWEKLEFILNVTY